MSNRLNHHCRPVISARNGLPILCMWDDCQRAGDRRFKTVRPHEDGGTITFLFCTEAHRVLFGNALHSYGNLPAGSKNLIFPA